MYYNCSLIIELNGETNDKEAKNIKEANRSVIDFKSDDNIVNKVTELLVSFSAEIPNVVSGSDLPRIKKSELIGALSAFLNNYVPDINVHVDHAFRIDTSKKFYADLLLETREDNLIVEVKSAFRSNTDTLSRGIEKVLNYLLLSDIKTGILYIPLKNNSEEMTVSKVEKNNQDPKYTIINVYPKSL